MKKITKHALILTLPIAYTLIVLLTYFAPNWLGNQPPSCDFICFNGTPAEELRDGLSLHSMFALYLVTDNDNFLPLFLDPMTIETKEGMITVTVTIALYLMVGFLLYMIAVFFRYAWRRVHTGGVKKNGTL